jgi:hypothetical protein
MRLLTGTKEKIWGERIRNEKIRENLKINTLQHKPITSTTR